MVDFDERPVGQHQGFEIPEFLSDNSKPLEHLPQEKQISKDSKERFTTACELFDELEAKLQSNELSSADVEGHLPALQKLLSDSHPGAQEKALDCFQLLITTHLTTVASKEVVSAVIEKCLSTTKEHIKEKAIESLLLVTESSGLVYILAKSLIETKSTTPKLTATALSLVTTLLENFGASSFSLQTLVPKIVAHINSSNAAIKTEAIKLLCELHRWTKGKVTIDLSPLKPTKQADLNKMFEADTEAPVPKRKTNAKATDFTNSAISASADTHTKDIPARNDSDNRIELKDKKAVRDCVRTPTNARRANNKNEEKAVDRRILPKANTIRTNSITSMEEVKIKKNVVNDDEASDLKVKEPLINNEELNPMLDSCDTDNKKSLEEVKPRNSESKVANSEETELEANATAAIEPKSIVHANKDASFNKPSKKSKQKESNESESTGLLAEVEQIITDKIPSSILNEFDKGAWKERQKKYQELSDWLAANTDLGSDFYDALAIWLKAKLKNFKESNMNIIKEAMELLVRLCGSVVISKKFANVITPGTAEKLGDMKLTSICQSLILSLSDCATPSHVLTIVINSVANSKSLSLIKNTLTLLLKMIEDYTAKLMPITVMLDYSKHCLEHSNDQIRSSGMEIITKIYSQLGKGIEPLILANLNELLKKNVENELAKTKIQDTVDSKRVIKGETKEKDKTEDIVNSLVPRVNISPQITSKLTTELKDKSMKVRQNAKDTLEKILAAANWRILPTGLSTLMNALKFNMNEPCKNLAKGFIALVGNLAAAMGPGCKQYAKEILQSLLLNLADKQAGVRAETLIAIDKFAEAGGLEVVFNCMSPLLEKDSPELRTEILLWMIKNKAHLNKANTDLLVRALIKAMQDRSKEIRLLVEQVVELIVSLSGHQPFIEAIKDLKPAVKRSLEAILEKHMSISQETSEVNTSLSKTTKSIRSEEAKVTAFDKSKDSDDSTLVESGRSSVTNTKKRAPKNLASSKQTNMVMMKSHTSIITPQNKVKSSAKLLNVNDLKATSQIVLKGGGKKKDDRSKNNLAVNSPKDGKMTKTPKNMEEDKYGLSRDSSAKNTLGTKNDTTINRGARIKNSNSKLNKKITTEEAMSENSMQRHGTPKKSIFAKSMKSNFTDEVELVQVREKSIETPTHKSSNSTTIDNESKHDFKDIGPVIISANKNKDKRAEEDKNLRWPVNELIPSNVEKLRSILATIMSPDMIALMFSDNPQEGIHALYCLKSSLKSNYILVVDILDLILKWCAMKFIRPNDMELNREIADFLTTLFAELYVSHYALQEFESASIIPILCEKLGSDMAEISRTLINKARDLCPVSKIYGYLLSSLESNNEKTKSEALGILIKLMKAYENQIVMRSDIVKVSKLLKSRDKTVRMAVAEFMMQIYKEKKEDLWNIISDISESDKEMLKQCIKFPDKMSQYLTSTEDSCCINFPAKPINQELNINTVVSEKGSLHVAKMNSGETQVSYKAESAIIEQCLKSLKEKNIATKADALVLFYEKILHMDQKILTLHASDIFIAFSLTLKELCINVSLKFAKYFLELFKHLCSLDYLVKAISETVFSCTMGGLLSALIKFTNYKSTMSTKYIMTLVNETIIILMNNFELIAVFKTLFDLIIKHKEKTQNPLYRLCIKCILKLCKSLKAPTLNIAALLTILHEYLLKNPPVVAINEAVAKIIRVVLDDLVKIKGELIWCSYSQTIEHHSSPDMYMKIWIKSLLAPEEASKDSSLDELMTIFKGLGHQTTFEKFIGRLYEYTTKHPEFDIREYFSLCSKPFSQMILALLNEYKSNPKQKFIDVDKKKQIQFVMEKLE